RVGHFLRKRRRPYAIEATADYEHWTTQFGQFVLHVRACQHSPDRRVARGIVAKPAGLKSFKSLDIAAKLQGVTVQHRAFDRARHALSLDPGEALKGCYAAIRRDPGRRTADHDGAGTLRVSGGEMKCDRAADRHARKRHLAGDSERIEQRGNVAGHGIEVEFAPRLL